MLRYNHQHRINIRAVGSVAMMFATHKGWQQAMTEADWTGALESSNLAVSTNDFQRFYLDDVVFEINRFESEFGVISWWSRLTGVQCTGSLKFSGN